MAKEKNKRLSELDMLMADVKGKHSKRMNAIMLTQGTDDEDAFAVNFHKLLEYASPKLQRSEIVEEAKEQKIVIEHVYRPTEPEGDKEEKK